MRFGDDRAAPDRGCERRARGVRRTILRALSFAALAAGLAFGTPAWAVNKTVNGITVDINLPQAQRGVPYSFQIAPTGGTGPYSFTILSGAFPAAFKLSSSGLVTGVNCSSTNGAYNASVRIVDGNGTIADFTTNQALSINMTAGPANSCALVLGTMTPSSGSNPKVGEPYSATISAPSGGGTAPYSYSIAGGALPTGLGLNAGTGEISGTPTASGSFAFSLKVEDSIGKSGFQEFTFTVDPADAITLSPASLTQPIVGTAFSQSVAAAGGTAPYSYSVTAGALPSGLSLDGLTGAITGTPTAAGAYSFTVRATDNVAATGSRSYAGAVAAALAITTAALPVPVIGQPYDQTVGASGGAGGTQFSVSAGALPAGLSLNPATGQITGAPTAAGAYSFTIQATDAAAATATQAYSGTIAAAVAITTAALPTPTINQAYSQTVATSGGTAPVGFTVSAGALPAGLALDGASGAITGTPTTVGGYSFTIRAEDANGAADAETYAGTIAGTLAISTLTLPTPVLGQAYSQSVAASGQTDPTAFAVSAGALPAGLALDGATGAITGTPTAAGVYSFTIQASDATTASASRAYAGTIAGAVAITSGALATPQIGQPYNQTVATSGGTAPIGFSVSAGALPAGLTLDAATGAITGTPTTTGAYSFTIQASDANGLADTETYSGTVSGTLAITTAALPTPLINQAYSQALAVSGASDPVGFSVSAGALPAGLALDPATGAITGVPTAAGAYAFTIQATDASSAVAAQAYAGTIAAAVAITTGALPTPVVGQAYNQTIAASGGTAPLAFSLSAGALPAGLSLDAATGAVTGSATTVGAYGFTVQVADANGATDTQAYSGTIGGTLAITTAALPTPALGQAYGQTVAVSGATNPVAFTVVAGALPAGLSLNGATGAVSGTPTAAGAYSFTIQAADATAATATQAYAGSIAPLAPDAQAAQAPFETDVGLVLTTEAGATLQLVTAPAHGTVVFVGGEAIYTPEPGYVGPDSFSYAVSGPGGVSPPTTVELAVLPPEPPTADSAPDQTIAGEPAAAGGVSTTTSAAQRASVDLTPLVRGVVTEIRLASQPSHGTVTLTTPAAAQAALARGAVLMCPKAGSAPPPNVVAVYTPNPGFLGRDQFTFVAVGPGGTSAPAFVNIDVVAAAPTAEPVAVTAPAGQAAAVSLTDGPGGPFTGAAIVSAPPASVGQTQLVEGGVPGNRTYQLVFTPAPGFSGVATIVYTLSNASGVSAPLTVRITVEPRPDPSLDLAVRGLADAEAETARRFAGAQVDNFRDRLEQVRRGGRGSLRLAAGLAEQPQPYADPRREAREPEAAAAAAAPAQPRGPRRVGEVEVWTGGALLVGERDASDGRARLSIRSSGLSAGADLMLSERWTLGAGAGYGFDRSRLGDGGSRLEARSLAAALYASYAPAEGRFADAVLGLAALDYDLRRQVSPGGPVASAQRDGTLVFGAVSAGVERSDAHRRWSAYGRLEGASARLGGYREQGPAGLALRYDARRIDSLAAVLGARIEVDRRLGEAHLAPRLRAELQHDLAEVADQALSYADWSDGPVYRVAGDGWARTRLSLGAGARASWPNGWSLDLDVSGEFGDDHRYGTFRLAASRRF